MIEEQLENNPKLHHHINIKAFKIKSMAATTIQKLIREVNSSIITQKMMSRYQKQLRIHLFQFMICHENREWVIKKRLTEFQELSMKMRHRYGKDAPVLPNQKQSDMTELNIGYIQQSLLIFLNRILELSDHENDEVINFLELLPEKYGSGIIHAEVRLEKHSGGRYTEATCSAKFRSTFCCCCRTWRKRYFTVTDHCIFYTIHSKSYDIKQMLTFSQQFKVSYGQDETGFQLGIIIQSTYRTLQLKTNSLYDFSIFINALTTALKKSPLSKSQRYGSFASVQDDCFSKFYIDGQYYFSDVCQALLKAEKYVYITDWMLTPYILLKRPMQLDNRSSRLDYVLESIAQRGVKIHIILYMEPQIALNNDSKFVETYLQQMNQNITVLRHPKYILIPFLWSHHQKIIVIDQKCAFLGGLDLCYGRWDTQKHSLENKNELWKGADYCNFRISDIYRPRNFLLSNLDPLNQPRMPWHDIAIQIRGPSVSDITRHFVQYWNFVSFQTRFNQRQLLFQSGHAHQPSRRTTIFSNFLHRQPQLPLIPNAEISLKQQEQQQKQKQYYDHFIDESSIKFKIDISNISMQQIRKYPKKILNYIKEGEDRDNLQRLLLPSQKPMQKYNKKGEQLHQIIRSASTWSLGLQQDKYQRSIYLAYQDCIKNAREFIYIQNQFFICKKNNICELLAERILRAYRNQEKFKVLILLPLLPGFEGEVEDDNSAVMRIQLNWEYVTLLRSKYSLFARISEIPNVSDYIQVLSLRAHAKLDEKKPVTEILYIHSKLLIIDDCKLIIGSANINDRSLLGDRDSQIGIVVEQKNLINVKGNHLVSESIHHLRCQLYKQHFALPGESVIDYHDEKVWQKIADQAQKNTLIYRQVFGCYPDDIMKTFKDIQEVKSNADLNKYDAKKEQIIGNVVKWPMLFLQSEDLTLRPNQKQFFVPDINFT